MTVSMRAARRCFVAAAALAAGGAQASTPLTILYHPRSVVELRGQVQVDRFDYHPANPKHKDNQIPNTAIGNIYLSAPIGEFIADGVRQELRTSGVSLAAGAECRLGGEVMAVKIADLGFDANFSLSVHYTLRGPDGRVVYDTGQDTMFMATKAGGADVSISLLFSKNINAVIGSDAFAKAFEANCPRRG